MPFSTSAKIAFQFHFSSLLGWCMRTPGLTRVLTFHGVEHQDSIGESDLASARFIEFLRFLAEERYSTITLQELMQGWPDSLMQPKRVILSFDDGYLSHWEIVYPILKQFGMTGTFFVPTNFISTDPSNRSFTIGGKKVERRFLGWRQLKQLSSEGFEVGSHGCSHARIGLQAPELARIEIQGSKSALEQELGTRIVSFAYPFGQEGAFTSTTQEFVRESGYLCACTQISSVMSHSTNPFELPRTDINSLDCLRTFKMKINGYYDLWYRLRHS